MPYRVISLVLAAFIGVTPFAREVCAFSCAGHHGSSATTHHDEHHAMAAHHMSHDEMADAAASAPPVSLSSSEHPCKHDGESQPAAFTAKVELAAPALLPHPIEPAAAILSIAALRAPVGVGALAPVPIALRTPLRV
jgi:hypothetical protein